MLSCDVMPVRAALWRVYYGMFIFQFFAKLNKSRLQLNSNGMEFSHFFIFCILLILINWSCIELNPGPKRISHGTNSHCAIEISIVLIHSFIYLTLVRKIICRKLQVYFLISTDCCIWVLLLVIFPSYLYLKSIRLTVCTILYVPQKLT